MPLYMEALGDRLSAMFSGKEKVFFEVKEENLPSEHKIETVTMYNKQGKVKGKISYAILPEGKVEIQSFNVDDWSPKHRFGQRLLKWYVNFMRKRGQSIITGGIYSTDTRTHDKIECFKSLGFEVMEMGAMAGHTEYKVELEI